MPSLPVQIPLWTIVTGRSLSNTWSRGVQIPLWTIVTYTPENTRAYEQRSDSSMDDCNTSSPATRKRRTSVQIPLWTIVTIMRALTRADLLVRSDSSMDDCNTWPIPRVAIFTWFRFLYGRL